MHSLLVTGGAGFIGSNFIRQVLSAYDYNVVNLDKLTYAGNLDNLRDVESSPRYRFVQGDICDSALVGRLMEEADAVANFAAETHVDRSLEDAGTFIQTEVYGTFVLLEAARHHGIERFLHVSTDEVYGDVPPGVSSKETDPPHPRSPYAASKAGAEHMCSAFYETYGLPVVISRGSNNIGPNQHLEKAVPLFITNALDDQPIPLYGDGKNVRDWQYVEDHCRALDLLLHQGEAGEAYNVGAGNEQSNIDVLETILALLEKPKSLIRFVEDRPGHDRRYSVDTAKIRALGWSPQHDFAAALGKTVTWYRENRWWWERVKSGQYREYYERMYGRRLAESKPFAE
ncbi:MAG: dTDP-glucose 4,6-dehydratase [Chloroflexi bacterium]|nr:dTDP-glucose 4,6-dehydratase [Chloroflexota bacterium]